MNFIFKNHGYNWRSFAAIMCMLAFFFLWGIVATEGVAEFGRYIAPIAGIVKNPLFDIGLVTIGWAAMPAVGLWVLKSYLMPERMILEGEPAVFLWPLFYKNWAGPGVSNRYGGILIVTRNECRITDVETDEVYVVKKAEITDQFITRNWKEYSYTFRTSNTSIPYIRLSFRTAGKLNKAFMEFGYSVPIVDNPKAG